MLEHRRRCRITPLNGDKTGLAAHGAGPGPFLAHPAVQEADGNGATTEWGEHATDEEYRA